LDVEMASLPARRASDSAGKRMPISSAMIEMTTKSSISVNPRVRL